MPNRTGLHNGRKSLQHLFSWKISLKISSSLSCIDLLLEHALHFPNYGFEVILSEKYRYKLQIESADTCYIIKSCKKYQLK